MNTIAMYAAILVLVLVVLAKIPGLEHTVRPLIDLVFTGVKVVIENSVGWFVWLFKLLWGAHLELLKHLMLSPEQIDPTVEMKNRVE